MNYKSYSTKAAKLFPVLILFVLLLQGCAGTKTYSNSVLAGETAVLAAGWKHYFTQDNITVTFTPESGVPVTYLPGDPAIRGVINLYPDPLSSAVLSDQLGVSISTDSLTYAYFINTYTNDESDWWQTTVYLDTPPSLPTGITTITITTPEGETASSTVNVTGPDGAPDTFEGEGSGPLLRKMFASMERVDHYLIEFAGTTVPEAIQIDLTATALITLVKNTRGDIATLNWSKSGDNYRVIITPSSQGSITSMSDFKFYMPIASGLAGSTTLSLANPVQAFDINGNTINDDGDPTNDVTANIILVKGAAGLYEL